MTGGQRFGARNAGARVTLQVIADRLAVSTATVSLALRDSPVVAEVTRERVRAVARDLGYVYNRSAASLRTARTNMVAVGFHDITNPFFAEILSSIETALVAEGRTVLLGTYGETLARQDNVLRLLKEYRPDGMILCVAAGTTADTVMDVVRAGVPVLQLIRETPGVDLDLIGVDDETGAMRAAEHLIALGHRRIALIGGSDAISTGRARRNGARRALAARGIPHDPGLVRDGLGTREFGLQAIYELLDLADPPTAAMCFNDLNAFGVMLGLRHRGLEPGRDVSVVGCDDVAEAALWAPPLTSIHNRQDELGREAARLLAERMADPDAPPRRVLLEPRLVVRGSTAPLRR